MLNGNAPSNVTAPTQFLDVKTESIKTCDVLGFSLGGMVAQQS